MSDLGDIVSTIASGGDLARMTSEQRTEYYEAVCHSLGLNPLTQPLQYIKLNGRLVLYAKRDAADQLRRIHGVSLSITGREIVHGDVYVVTARAQLPDGRCDESTGAVNIEGLKGEALANALMKAETKAKRRVTLSIIGLGWLDETEIDSIPDASPASVDIATGDIADSAGNAGNAGNRGHWILDSNVRARFWAWIDRIGLTKDEVHEALGVESVVDFGGSMRDAKERIEEWIVAHGSIAETEDMTGVSAGA